MTLRNSLIFLPARNTAMLSAGSSAICPLSREARDKTDFLQAHLSGQQGDVMMKDMLITQEFQAGCIIQA